MAAVLAFFVFAASAGLAAAAAAHGELRVDYYDEACPQALAAIKLVVAGVVLVEPRMGASLVRLHFHDCFVNGCDGSILLDDTEEMAGEKMAKGNNMSTRGYGVIDAIKLAVNVACLGNVVSCADILAVAARDSIVALGGSSYDVPLGRRDATTASLADANDGIPNPFMDLPELLRSFESHGMDLRDLVVLSGAHTLGYSRCVFYRGRLYNETGTLDPSYAASLDELCPASGGHDEALAPLDDTPTTVDTDYYRGLMHGRALLHTDQQLYRGDGGESDGMVRHYAEHPTEFREHFVAAMVKLGGLSPLTGDEGEVRENCRMVNQK